MSETDLEKFVNDPQRDIGDRFDNPSALDASTLLAVAYLDGLGRFWRWMGHANGSYVELVFDPDPERQRQAFNRRDLVDHGLRDGHDASGGQSCGSDVRAILQDTAGPKP